MKRWDPNLQTAWSLARPAGDQLCLVAFHNGNPAEMWTTGAHGHMVAGTCLHGDYRPLEPLENLAG